MLTNKITGGRIEEKPLITISREKGSGGRPIAYIIAEKLGPPWKVYHQEIVEQIAHEKEMKEWFSQQTGAEAMNAATEVLDKTFGQRFHELSTYYQDLTKLIAVIGNKGHSIMVGRGAHFLFPTALKVRLICSPEQRTQWLMEYEHVSHKEALNLIEESDQRKDEFIRAVFGHDHKVPYHYDLIIRTSSNIKLEDAATTIVHLARRRFGL